MSNVRHFGGSRPASSGDSVAREIMRFEMQKKAKMPADMRYKLIFKRKREEAQRKAEEAAKDSPNAGAHAIVRKRSDRANQALKEIAQKKAAKEAKKLRHMVFVTPQKFSNGHINKKGVIYDIAGNIVGKVNTKNGKMSAGSGMPIGKYKPKSFATKLVIQDAINKYSPYFIKQRQLAMQQGAMSNVHGAMGDDPNVIDVHGNNMSARASMLGGGAYDSVRRSATAHGNSSEQEEYGVMGPTQMRAQGAVNGTMTAWGAMSDNVWGNMSNNVWGNLNDNVWGGSNSDVWGNVSAHSMYGTGGSGGGGGGDDSVFDGGGGYGGGGGSLYGHGQSMWGKKGPRIFGTGNGINLLTGMTKWVLGVLGYQSRKARMVMRHRHMARAAANGGYRTGARAIRVRR